MIIIIRRPRNQFDAKAIRSSLFTNQHIGSLIEIVIEGNYVTLDPVKI
jgi:hypothetical protein